MSLDTNLLKKRLNALNSQSTRKSGFWKPQPGTQTIRIVPYKENPSNPFVELLFHYNIGGKTYLSPFSFGQPDPILEFAQKLKKQGDRESWSAAKKMEPKLRTFVPVIVRGEEKEGVRWWGFGKTVYTDILALIADPDYGDITDAEVGRDIKIEYITAEDAGMSFPQTKILARPKQSPIHPDEAIAKSFLEEQEDIISFYTIHTYDELKVILDNWLNPDAEGQSSDDDSDSVSKPASLISKDDTDDDDDDDVPVAKAPTKDVKAPVKERRASSDFDDMFDN